MNVAGDAIRLAPKCQSSVGGAARLVRSLPGSQPARRLPNTEDVSELFGSSFSSLAHMRPGDLDPKPSRRSSS